ncbi:PGR5-like protein 1A, chloroplastic [Dichanthelium oligosanthes]|uniref:PGR5-like protein 1A, chloroplastic n=1 Tax=Dichanthelium oligosanthes TaxID=888268 RepID=A0A1E5UKX0_9POAL|nr:PGR5-like protein 1A, chloroplastic [Dichanthelium oligosanthes]
MACDARLSLPLPCRLPALLPPPPPALRRSPRAAAASTSPRCRVGATPLAPARPRAGRWRPARAASEGEAQGQVQQAEGEVVDSNVLPYCSIDRKQKKTIGEMEQEFLQALQARRPDEQRLLEASMAYVAGSPIMTDAEFDELKLRLKVYSDLTVDYFKMFLLNVPAAVVALTLFFFLDDLTGFEITYLLELPEPFSFIFTWFAALPLIFWIAQAITNAIVKDFLILKGPCPNCGNENLSFFGTILSVPSGGAKNNVKCANCSTELVYDSASRLITLPELAEA